MIVITYPCWNESQSVSETRTPEKYSEVIESVNTMLRFYAYILLKKYINTRI